MSEEQGPIRLRRRVVVHSDVRDALRRTYGDACQVCGRVTQLTADETYAEVHAIGSAPDAEPEDAGQGRCVVLCPEHHALFDAGAMALHPDSLTLHAAHRRNRFDGRALAHGKHALSTEALRAAWKQRVEPPEDDPDGMPRLRTIDAFLEYLFAAAVNPDEEAGFERYLFLVPGGRDLASAGRESHRKFAWAQLRRRTPAYLTDDDPTSFEIFQMQPAQVTDDTNVVRVMVSCRGRNPAPIRVERDEHGFWWLGFLGL